MGGVVREEGEGFFAAGGFDDGGEWESALVEVLGEQAADEGMVVGVSGGFRVRECG